MKKRYLKGSVILNPVPVVLITCRNLEGKENIFTVAWIGTVCSKPPMLSISIRPERLSYDYIKETMEFTVNIPNRKLTKITDFCGVRSGRQINKIEEMNLTMIKGSEIETSFIEECPISIECKVKEIIKLGSHDMFIAEILCSHINEDLFNEKDKIDLTKADLIAYSHGEYFSVDKNPLGKFGYSVMKKKKKKIKNK